jgi:hypothetical protein
MKKTAIVITLATLYVLLYHSSPIIGLPDEFIIGMFILSPIVVVYLVYTVLKYGKPSGHTFEERFYDDYDHRKTE